LTQRGLERPGGAPAHPGRPAASAGAARGRSAVEGTGLPPFAAAGGHLPRHCRRNVPV